MTKISKEVGAAVRNCRRARHLSLEQLAYLIQKGKSTVAKYETGEIGIDIDTLYEIAHALKVSIESLLVPQQSSVSEPQGEFVIPPFFKDRILYAYFWDGRNNKLNASVLKIGTLAKESHNIYHATLYMNVPDLNQPFICENTYNGTIEFHHILINLTMVHRDTPVEHVMIHILENFTSTQTKWGMFCGISFRPFMPVAVKMLFSRTPLTFDQKLLNDLKINREDIRKIKMYNYFSITQEW